MYYSIRNTIIIRMVSSPTSNVGYNMSYIISFISPTKDLPELIITVIDLYTLEGGAGQTYPVVFCFLSFLVTFLGGYLSSALITSVIRLFNIILPVIKRICRWWWRRSILRIFQFTNFDFVRSFLNIRIRATFNIYYILRKCSRL